MPPRIVPKSKERAKRVIPKKIIENAFNFLLFDESTIFWIKYRWPIKPAAKEAPYPIVMVVT